jgi:hypothetical protein
VDTWKDSLEFQVDDAVLVQKDINLKVPAKILEISQDDDGIKSFLVAVHNELLNLPTSKLLHVYESQANEFVEEEVKSNHIQEFVQYAQEECINQWAPNFRMELSKRQQEVN